MTRTGSCLCGKVRYSLEGEPFLTGVCPFADCRKDFEPAEGKNRSSAAILGEKAMRATLEWQHSVFTFYSKWPLAAFRVTGLVRTSHGRSFCPDCGSRLFNLHDDDVEIRLGSLDDAPTGRMPMQEGWTIRREHWLIPIPNIVHADRDPPG